MFAKAFFHNLGSKFWIKKFHRASDEIEGTVSYGQVAKSLAGHAFVYSITSYSGISRTDMH